MIMNSETKYKTLIDSPNISPSLIIDKTGRVIAFSNDFKKILPSITPQSNFFELFDEVKLLTLQRMFIDVRKYDTPVRDIIDLEMDKVKYNFEVVFSPLRSENNVYFLINLNHESFVKNTTETQKFWISTSELEKIAYDKRIVSIVNKIKLNYPFSFIEKAKVQKDINELDDYFWIKESSGKLVLVNDKYADSLGFKSNQLENKNEQDYLPKYLVNLYKTVDAYIIDSTNSVIFEGIVTPVTSGTNRNISVVEFPLCDLDNNVVAIIGFSQKKEHHIQETKIESGNFIFKDLPVAILLIDKNFKITSYSKEFIRLLNLNDKVDLSLMDLSKIFEKGFISQFENYLKNADRHPDVKTNYLFVEKAQFNTEVSFKKIFDLNGEFYGTQIIITQKLDADQQIETKAKMYEALIEHLPEAMFIYDIENLKFLDVNDAALKLYGYKRNDFLNMDLTDLYAPEDIQTLIQTGDSKIVQGSYSGPWRHKKNDGTSVLVELRRSSLEFRGKKSHLNLVRNVSEQAESKKRTQIIESAFDNTSDPVIITDKDGFITEINEPVSKRFGYSKKDLETRPFISLVADDDRAKINKNIFHSGILKPTILDVEIKKPSGIFVKTNSIATPIKNFSGDIDSFCWVIKPIDEPVITKDVKKTQEDSIEKIDPPFLSNVFHELLTPINVILGFTQELGESIQKPNEEQKEAVDIIKQNQKLLLQIMDNAVEYSTLEQKVVKLKSEHIKFVDMLNELKENTKKTAEDKKVELSYGKISSALEIETDRQKIVSLLSLFIKFAIQITKEDKIFLSASVYQDNYCAVSIKDTSKTITPYLLKAFNDIFADEENMTRRNYGFSRFSVKLAKKLIDLLSIRKETITKDADPIEFALVIPLKLVINDMKKLEVETVPQQKVSGKQPEKVSTPSLVSVEKKPLDLTQLTCLYLEDQVDSQMLFKSQMKDLKNIEFAPSFENALPLLKTKKFDFLVMDINLQGEYNGLDALRIIQKMPGYKNVPVIASTAYLLPGARDSFIAAGFNDFVSKPLLRDKLMEVLKTLFT